MIVHQNAIITETKTSIIAWLSQSDFKNSYVQYIFSFLKKI